MKRMNTLNLNPLSYLLLRCKTTMTRHLERVVTRRAVSMITLETRGKTIQLEVVTWMIRQPRNLERQEEQLGRSNQVSIGLN